MSEPLKVNVVEASVPSILRTSVQTASVVPETLQFILNQAGSLVIVSVNSKVEGPSTRVKSTVVPWSLTQVVLLAGQLTS
jgi:hypothetical protein